MRKTEKADQKTAVREIATRLRISVGAFVRRARETSAAGDLTGPELTVLSRLDRSGPATTAELARREQITPQAVGATIAGLEQHRLVTRTPDPTDGRRSIITLTPAGRTAVVQGRSAIVDGMVTALDESFTAEEIAILDAAAPLIERLAQQL